MTVHRVSRSAEHRARRAARAAARCGVLILVGFGIVRAGSNWGYLVVLACVAIGYVELNRHMELRELASTGHLLVDDIARALPVLHPGDHADELLVQVAHLESNDHALVHDGQRWLVVTKGVLVDTVLSSTEPIAVARLGRRAPTLDPMTPVDHLSRPPYDGEVWLVGGSEPPRGVERQDLLRATADRRAKVLA